MKLLTLQNFPLQAFDKLRYADTDRQVGDVLGATRHGVHALDVDLLLREQRGDVAHESAAVVGLDAQLRREPPAREPPGRARRPRAGCASRTK